VLYLSSAFFLLKWFSKAKRIWLAKLDTDSVNPRECTSRGSGAATTSGVGCGPRFRLVHQEELSGHHQWWAVLGAREPKQLAVARPLDHSPSVTVLIVVGSVLDDYHGGDRAPPPEPQETLFTQCQSHQPHTLPNPTSSSALTASLSTAIATAVISSRFFVVVKPRNCCVIWRCAVDNRPPFRAWFVFKDGRGGS